MRIDLATVRSTGFAGQNPAALLSDWRVGAILQATAVRDSRNGQLWLQIGDLRYPARLASGDTEGPSDGERLTVRVLRNSPVLALEALSSETTAGTDDATSDALRRYLPRQASPAPLLSNLAWIANGKADAQSQSLPPAVTQAASKLWQALPDALSLTDPASLKSAIAKSGAFLESTLATGDRRAIAAMATQDLKALLLNFARVLRDHGARPAAAMSETSGHSPVPLSNGPLSALPPAPATLAVLDTANQQLNELARQTDGALARMTTLQVGSAPQDTPVQTMLLELPMRQGERTSIVRMRIEQDRSRKHDPSAADTWSIEAAMDLGAVGALHARVGLQGHRLSVQLRAESAAVVETLAARAPELESLLRESGLDIDRVVCLHGMPAGDAGARTTRLLDLRA
ncbi:MAG: flagellar hook-length control protein FliK [Povalibacter sp.]